MQTNLKVGHKILLTEDGKKYKVTARYQNVYVLRRTGFLGLLGVGQRQIWVRRNDQYRIIK